MAYPLRSKTVLVTGAAGGIGEASCRELHRRGANVVITDLDQAAVDRVGAGLGGERTLALALDVTDRAALEAVVAAAVERFGGLDVAFANRSSAAASQPDGGQVRPQAEAANPATSSAIAGA